MNQLRKGAVGSKRRGKSIRDTGGGKKPWGERWEIWHHRRWRILMGENPHGTQVDDLSRSFDTLDQNTSLTVVVEMSQSSCWWQELFLALGYLPRFLAASWLEEELRMSLDPRRT